MPTAPSRRSTAKAPDLVTVSVCANTVHAKWPKPVIRTNRFSNSFIAAPIFARCIEMLYRLSSACIDDFTNFLNMNPALFRRDLLFSINHKLDLGYLLSVEDLKNVPPSGGTHNFGFRFRLPISLPAADTSRTYVCKRGRASRPEPVEGRDQCARATS